MPIYILCNSAMKSLFRKYQGHILLVLAKKNILTKHLESYEDYPKELFKNCLRFSPMVDKTTDINSHCILNSAGVYHTVVVLDASDENRTGSLKLCLYIDLLLTCSERPTEIVRKCWTPFRNVSFRSKKENKTEAATQLLLVTPLYTWKSGNNVWELGDACDFHTAFVWLSWTWTDICQHCSGYSCS